jgi:V/A-type H+-transporting ATPase subunit C
VADDTRYAYAVARIRGLETRLLDRQWIERLLGENAEGALKVLSDSAFQEAMTSVDRPEDVEQGLTRALGETLAAVSEISPEPELVDLFRVRHDFRNLRSLVKAALLKMLGGDGELPIEELGLTDGVGIVELQALSKAATDGDYLMLPQHLTDAVREAAEAYRDTGDLSRIDSIFERAMWAHQLEVANRYGSEFLIDYFTAEIDLANVRSFVRIKEAGGEVTDIERSFIPGGTLARSFFDELLGESLDSLARALEYGGYAELTPVLREWTREAGPALELACDNVLLSRVDHASRVAYGIEPLVAFVLVKQIEIKLVRAAVTSKLDGIARGELEGRLRAVHV